MENSRYCEETRRTEREGTMKITILDPKPGEEDEVIIKCQNLTEELQNLIQRLKQGNARLAGYDADGVLLLEQNEIYYFEAVDNKVFACCEKEVYEVHEKLYTLEELLTGTAFMRASKSTILNLDKVKSLSPAFGGRFEAVLDNGEKTIISRQYVPVLKERLGL